MTAAFPRSRGARMACPSLQSGTVSTSRRSSSWSLFRGRSGRCSALRRPCGRSSRPRHRLATCLQPDIRYWDRRPSPARLLVFLVRRILKFHESERMKDGHRTVTSKSWSHGALPRPWRLPMNLTVGAQISNLSVSAGIVAACDDCRSAGVLTRSGSGHSEAPGLKGRPRSLDGAAAGASHTAALLSLRRRRAAPYRGFLIRWSRPNSRGWWTISGPAEWNSAIQQIGNLRYRLAPNQPRPPSAPASVKPSAKSMAAIYECIRQQLSVCHKNVRRGFWPAKSACAPDFGGPHWHLVPPRD
jgi:hypothetical protein